jgi:aspartyl-tRNA(Asn)/glutamyl-tRNA(Gln) amidotransferase subunit B
MNANFEAYEIVAGLEVHAQLLTRSKLFCGDSIEFGAEPNTHVSPITLAHPGVLPKMNKKAIEFAVRIGTACHCEIERENYFARKNYFYPDLPKGYQLSQHTTPICKGGYISIKTSKQPKHVRLNRIHLEEDAGKSLHDLDPENTCVDYNRAGTPLIEIVSEPDLSSGDEAYAYLTELRKLVRYLEVCDGNMEEGSLRCDANISVRKKGDDRLGTKVEVKNLNSIRNVKRAIEFEAERMIGMLENGETIIQQTRSFDANSGTTFSLRDKEDAEDYRYFPEPDLTKFFLAEDFIQEVQSSIPVLQQDRVRKYTTHYQLSEYDATVLTEEKAVSDYFEKIIQHTKNYKAAANWMLGPIKSWSNKHGLEISAFPLQPVIISSIISMIDEGELSFSTASSKLFDTLLKQPGRQPREIALEKDLLQTGDDGQLAQLVDEVLDKLTGKVTEYKKGKKGLLGLFVKEVMKLSRGKADPKKINELLTEKLR